MFSKNQLYVSPEGSKAIQPNLCVILFFRYGTALEPVIMRLKKTLLIVSKTAVLFYNILFCVCCCFVSHLVIRGIQF